MSSNFLVEKAEDFKKEMKFDKFMDEIVLKEETSKSVKKDKEDDEDDHNRRIINRVTDRPVNNIRFRRK
jgi:hypothetical protein